MWYSRSNRPGWEPATFKTAYNPNLGAAMSLVLMILIFVCVSIMNRFGETDEEEVMAKV